MRKGKNDKIIELVYLLSRDEITLCMKIQRNCAVFQSQVFFKSAKASRPTSRASRYISDEKVLYFRTSKNEDRI